MADPKRVDGGSGVAGVAQLLQLIGGEKKSTSTSADTSGLQSILGQLQSQDPTAALQTLFQTMQGAAPALQARFSNSVGARSGSNSGVETALSKLMQQTVLAGQAQISEQQLRSLGLQGQVAGDLARLNSTTTSKQGVDFGGAAKGIAGLQLGSKLYSEGSKLFTDDNIKKGKDAFSNLFQTADAPSLSTASFDADLGITNSASGVTDGPALDFAALADTAGSAIGSGVEAVSDWWNGLEFADGGLVGRDGKPGEKPGYADGGSVKLNSGGGRRSSAPSYTPDAVMQSLAQGMSSLGTPGAKPASKPSQSGTASPSNAGDAAEGFGWGQVGKIGMAMAMGNPLGMIGAIASAIGVPKEAEFGLKAMQALEAKNPLAAIQALMALTGKTKADNAFGTAPEGTMSATESSMMGPAAAAIGEALGVTPSTNAMSVNPSAALGLADALGSSSGGQHGALGAMGSYGGGASGNGWGGGGPGGFGGGMSAGSGSGYGNGSSGGSGSGGGNGYGGGGGGDGAAANGGPVKGKGTGTSDSIDARLSAGEYIVSADVVKQLGADFFDRLQSQFHTPVQERQTAGNQV